MGKSFFVPCTGVPFSWPLLPATWLTAACSTGLTEPFWEVDVPGAQGKAAVNQTSAQPKASDYSSLS